MKKTFLSLLSVILVLLTIGIAVAGCKKEKLEEPDAPEEEPTESFDMKITPRFMDLVLDSTAQIVVKITPDDLEGVEITYKSSDSDIASVTKKGFVTGKAIGSATITVTATYGGEEVERKCGVSVFSDVLSIAEDEYTVFKGENIQLEAKLASGKEVKIEWKSLNTDVATVDMDGLVFGISSGDAQIVAMTTYDEKQMTDTCTIHVTEVVKISSEMIELSYIGATQELSCNVGNATWETRDASIVSISGDGAKRTIKGLAEGNTFVVVSYAGKSDSCAVRVGNPPLVIIPEGETLDLAKDDTLTLMCGYEANWTIESGSSYIQLLDQDSKTCRVVGIAQGEAVVSASFGEHKDTRNINVVINELKITPAGPIDLEATHEQIFSSNLRGVQWEIVSGDEYIELDAATGKVTAKLEEGQAVIKATAGEQSQTAVINVFMQPLVVTPASIYGRPWLDYFDFECNYYELYGREATFDCGSYLRAATESDYMGREYFYTEKGKCRVHIATVWSKITDKEIEVSCAGKTTKVRAQISLPELEGVPASVDMKYSSGAELKVSTNYHDTYMQSGGYCQLINPQPENFLEQKSYNEGYRFTVRGSGSATLRIFWRDETVDVPIVIRP